MEKLLVTSVPPMLENISQSKRKKKRKKENKEKKAAVFFVVPYLGKWVIQIRFDPSVSVSSGCYDKIP